MQVGVMSSYREEETLSREGEGKVCSLRVGERPRGWACRVQTGSWGSWAVRGGEPSYWELACACLFGACLVLLLGLI